MNARTRLGARDPIGLYFDCFQQATGSRIDFDLGTVDASGAVTWRRMSHVEHDGIGALLRDTEGRVSVLRPPRRPPPRGTGIRALPAYLRSRACPSSPLTVDYDAPGEGSRAFRVLSEEECSGLKTQARGQGGSFTALLLSTLHQALMRLAPAAEGRCAWSYPIDLRGAVTLPDPTANHVVALLLPLGPDSSPAEITRTIQAQLERGLHFGAWALAEVLARFGPHVLRPLIRGDQVSARARRQWFAVFSNLGALRGPEHVAARVVIGPVSATSPLTATALTWNGRLALGLNLHAGLAVHGLTASNLLDAWLDGLTAPTSASPSQPLAKSTASELGL